MLWVRRFTYLYRNLVRRNEAERELDEEVQAFYDICIDRYMSRGLSREEAIRAARLALEGKEQVKQKVRERRAGMSIETITRDVQYAWRMLRNSPGFTMVAVLTLGLGIGANTAIFSLINTVMLRWLPVQHPEQLVLLTDPAQSGVAVDTTEHGVRFNLSYPEFQELRTNQRVFSGLLAAQNDVNQLDVLRAGNPHSSKAHTELVSGNFFQVLGVAPVLGRFFTLQQDEAPGANPVAVISYSYWRREFAGDPKAVGSTVKVGQGVFQILGVAPPGFHGILVGSDADLWFPITMQEQVLPGRDYLRPRDTLWLQVMGRLAPGVSISKAQAGINTIFQQLLREWAASAPTPRESRLMLNERIELRPGSRGASAIRGEFADPLLLLMSMVGVVLLVACANIANLMLARASSRQREIGVRLALGAPRVRLIRQLLTESLLIGILGGGLGVLLSAIATRLLLSLVSTGVDNLGVQVRNDYRVLLFTAALSLLTVLLFGLTPALRGTKLDINRTLAANARGSASQGGQVHMGWFLSVAQVTLSLVLLMSAALLVRSLHNMLSQNLGYDHDHLLMINVDPAAAGYEGPSATTMYETAREQLERVPGVRSVSVSNQALFTGESGDHLSIEGSPEKDPDKLAASWIEVGADYFRTLGIPLLSGREIDAADASRKAAVCVINESFLKRFFPDGHAIGNHVTDEYPTTRETFEIIGVVPDSKQYSPTETSEPRFYANISHPIGTVPTVTYLLSTPGEPAGVAAEAQKILRKFDRNLPILSVRTVNQQMDRRLIKDRLIADLAGFFGVLALAMSAIGRYGVMSYSIARRTSEIGIRMALGASASGVIQMVLRETLTMAVIGIAVGLPCGFAFARVLSSKLYGLTAADPLSMTMALSTVLAAATLAGYVPARRAARVDPMTLLRHD